jgi:hypothetical protein
VQTFDPSFNYLDLLELTPAEALRTRADAVRAAIVARKKEWTAKEQNPLYQQEARQTKERLLQLERLLADTDAFVAYARYQAELQAEKRQEQEEAIGRLVATAAGRRRQITPRQAKLLRAEARALRAPESVVDDVLDSLGITVRVAAAPDRARPVVPRLDSALDRIVFNEIHGWLKVLDKPTLYALLDLPETAPPAELVAAARLLYSKWSKTLPKTSECTAWEKTTQACFLYLKDQAGKERYNGALFNHRIDLFLKRVDLVLAGAGVGKAEVEVLARVGAQDFGLAAEVARECVEARAAESGVALPQPLAVTDHLDGHVRCFRCFTWSPAAHPTCRQCASPMQRVCLNPGCRNLLPADVRACPHCRIPVARSRRFAALLELTDAFLARGNGKAAMDSCSLAEQILPGAETSRRMAQARQVRLHVDTLRSLVAQKRWTKAAEELRQVLALAPRFSRPGIPQLEALTDYMVSTRNKLNQLPADADPVQLARAYLACLTSWTDCPEAEQRARHLCVILGERQRHDLVPELACKLLELRPDDEELVALVRSVQARRECDPPHPELCCAAPAPEERNGHAVLACK